jgi:hypothetical protein
VVIAAPSLLVTFLLGIRMLADENLRTRLNKVAVTAGFAAPALVVASLFAM